jgi:uncharacterized membrane protein YhaH (DUF805 family)
VRSDALEINRGIPMDGKRKYSDDEVIKAWPWFGGTPGKAARKIFALWVLALVALVLLTIYAFATLHICLAVGLIFVIALIAVAPSLFLIGSRI